MKKVDLTGNPFYLNEKQIKWVEDTKKSMTLEEKIGQLFFLIGMSGKKKDLSQLVVDLHPGGLMYRTTAAKKVVAAHKTLQRASKVPMLLAANLEAGGNGLLEEGTNYGAQMMVGATDDENYAYKLGLIAGREASSVGGNMAFAPVIDINYNFRNPIANTRAFGDRPDLVGKMGAAYVKGAQEAGLSVTIKHFPGDGTDGRDQHLVTTHNALDKNKWKASFGDVYTTCIRAGARGLMVGHIGLPGYFEDNDPLKYVPATLNPTLLNKLLREELGYNGLTMTDASLMTGFGQMGKREDLVPKCIAAGCDMFLFTRMPQDDYRHMINGYRKGVISDERLDEAVTRILATKASLNLHKKTLEELVPNNFNQVDLLQHKKWADEMADHAITLVKDEQKLLPLSLKKYKKIGVMYNGNSGGMAELLGDMPGLKGFAVRTMMRLSKGKKEAPYEKLVNALNRQGFEAFYYSFGDIMSIFNDMTNKTIDEWKSQFDLIIYLTKWESMSNQTSLQLQYRAAGFDAPWFVEEVPTILVSLANPYHGYDLPMMKTVINAYAPTDEAIEGIAEKLAGKSEFKGVSPVKLDFKEFQGIL